MAPQDSMTESRTSHHGEHDDEHHSHHRRRSRRQPRFPPVSYTDLTRADMSTLAPLLLPPHPQSDRSVHEKELKKRLAALPQHLQAKHPWLSTFCSLHSRLNPILIDNLFAALRAEVEDELTEVWIPLKNAGKLSQMKCEIVEIQQNLAVLWLGPQVYAERYGKQARRTLTAGKGKCVSKCGACLLTAIGRDYQTIMQMGACFIGRLSENLYKWSKRIWWFEAWAGSCVTEAKRAWAIQLMWQTGVQFRKARLEAGEHTAGPEKGFADSMLAGSGILDRPSRPSRPSQPRRPSRPPREPSQDGDVDLILSQSGSDVRESELQMSGALRQGEVPDDDLTRTEGASLYAEAAFEQAAQPPPPSRALQIIPRKPVPQRATHEARGNGEDDRSTLRPRVASSVYSRNVAGDRSTTYEIDDIISLYRHSKLVSEDFLVPTQDPDSLPPVPTIPNAWLTAYLDDGKDSEPEPEPGNMPPQPKYNNPYPLENVYMPRRDPDRDSQVSRIFRQQKERKPALRMGKKGEVKTAFDAVSVASNESEEHESKRRR